MILLVNQHTVPVFTDVANAFAVNADKVRLMTGHVEPGRVGLHPKVSLIKSVAYNRHSTFTRLMSWIAFSIHYFFYLCFGKKPDHIFVVTNPPLAPFITSLVARWRNIPFHIVVFDLYPEALMQAGLANQQSNLFTRWQRNNSRTFAKANGLITLSESMKKAVAKYVSESNIKVIFNWADTDYIRPVPKSSNPFVTRHRLTDKFVILYAGNMGLTHDLESLLDAAAILKQDTRIQFVLIGEGGKKETLERIKKDKALNNVLFLPYQNSADFPFAMASADIGIVTLGTGAEGISVPSKTYINMAAGLAVMAISPAGSELDRIIDQFKIGYAVEPGQPDRLAQLITLLAEQPSLIDGFKSASRAAALNFTSANATQYVKLIYPDTK